MSKPTTEVLCRLFTEIEQGGVTDSTLTGYLDDPNRMKDNSPVYRVTLDYNRNLVDMIMAGEYNQLVHPYRQQTEYHAKSGRTTEPYVKDFLADSGKGTVVRHLRLISFNDPSLTFQQLIVFLEHNQLEMATAREILAFGEQYPHKQLEFPIKTIGEPRPSQRRYSKLCGTKKSYRHICCESLLTIVSWELYSLKPERVNRETRHIEGNLTCICRVGEVLDILPTSRQTRILVSKIGSG